jgi:putative NADPH-quinone reductase
MVIFDENIRYPCHPNPKSFNHAIAHTAAEALRKTGTK